MKITKNEFKSIIKECLQELIAEGALDHMVGGMIAERTQQTMMQDPRIRMAAMQAAGGNPQQANIMEQIFADTAMTSLPQQASNMLPNGMSLPPGMNMGMLGEVRAPLPPRDPSWTPPQQAQPQSQGPATNWARLAFNSPISNRPGGPRTSGDFLPGSKKGSFE